MSELRDLLDREARRISARPDALDQMRDRAERRHRNRRIVAGATALVLVAAVGLGAWTLLGNRPDGPTPPADSPVASSRAEAVAEDYARSNFGWTDVWFDEGLDGDFEGMDQVDLYVSSCNTLTEGCEGMSVDGTHDEEALLTLERDGDGWRVAGAVGPERIGRYGFLMGRISGGTGAACPSEPFAPLSDQMLADAFAAFLETTNARVPDPEAAWSLLDPAARGFMAPYALWEHKFMSTPVEGYEGGDPEYLGPDVANEDQLRAEKCGVPRESFGGVHVTFPDDPNLAASPGATLVFVAHPDGVTLWFARQD